MRKSNEEILDRVRDFVMKDKVEEKYKSKPQDFTRSRILPFKFLVVFMLRKLYKKSGTGNQQLLLGAFPVQDAAEQECFYPSPAEAFSAVLQGSASYF
jgi:hypothetical protein